MSCEKGLNWTLAETKEFVALCTAKQITMLMNGKLLKHLDIFRSLEKDMALKNFDKTAEQMRLKLKNLKLAYYKCKRDNDKSGAGRNTCPFYEELDFLYGCRPNSEALDSKSGIDTADPLPREDYSTTDGSIDLSSVDDSSVQQSSSHSGADEPRKKKRTRNLTGRNTYQSMLDSYNNKWVKSQEKVLKTILETQNKQQEEILHKELESQRQWEAELLLKEQQFQREQTAVMMQTFMQCMQGIRSPNPQSATHVNITPMKRPVSSTLTSLFTPDLAETPQISSVTGFLTPRLSSTNPTASSDLILTILTPTVMTGSNNDDLHPLKTIRLVGKRFSLKILPASPGPISKGVTATIAHGDKGCSYLPKIVTSIGRPLLFTENSENASLE